MQCHSITLLLCLPFIEVSLGKNIDKVNCNSKGSLPEAEINRIPCVETVSGFLFHFNLHFSLSGMQAL